MKKNKKVKIINKEKIKDKFNKFKNKIIHIIKRIKANPKKEFKCFLNIIKNKIKNNELFCLFVFVTVLNSTLMRFVTIHNYFNLKPLLADLAFVLLIGSFYFIIKPKRKTGYLIFWHIFLTLLCFIHSIYYTFYSSFGSISLLSNVRFIFDVGDSVTENVFQIKDLIYWIPTICFLHRVKVIKKKNSILKNKNKKKFTTTLGVCLGVFLLFCINVSGVEWSRFAKQWNRVYIVNSFGLYTYQTNDIVQSIKPKLNSLFGYDKAYKGFKDYFSDTKKTEDNEFTNIYKGKNILVIHCESMMNFVIDKKFNGVEVTPNLNKLANNGMYFNNFYAQVSVGTSSDSEFTLNTSLMPSNSGTVFVSYFNRTYNSIPKLLKEQGYYTFSMHANNKTFWNRNAMYEAIGYDRFYNKEDYEVTEDNTIGLGLADEYFFEQSIPYIKELHESDKPFYGTVLMLSNHTPFSDIDKYGEFDVSLHEKDENGNDVTYNYLEGTKLGNYLKSAHYADKALGLFLDELEQEGILDDTILVLYGDHDNRLSKKEYDRFYNYDKENDSILTSEDEGYVEFDSYDYELNRSVPFIIYDKTNKNNQMGTKYNYPMGMYNVMPTLGNMFGFYNKYQLGKDIFAVRNDNIVPFPNGNWISSKIYYNSQKSEYKTLSTDAIADDYIDNINLDVSKLLNVSNDIIVFDLIKHDTDNDSQYISEVTE